MQAKYQIDLDDARRVAAAAELEALNNASQVVIAIVDDGGHLMYLQRDKAQLGSIEIAIEKAKTALMFRRPGQFWEEVLANGRQGYLSVTGILALEGGVPLEHEGQIVGAIGISGAKSIEDGIIAKAGAAAL